MFLTESEGEIPFEVPGANKPCKTWYKIVGDLKTRTRRPLVALHGGPGGTHHYLLSLASFASNYGIPVVFYDQLGNGNSTHLPEKRGDGEFWTESLFCDELDNLLVHLGIQDDYDLLGHSWGGMLGARFATYHPAGLKHLILSDAPASMEVFVEGCNRLRKNLPKEVQETLTRHEEAGTTHEQAYDDAVQEFLNRYCCRVQPWPEEVKRGFEIMAKDPTVYMTMNGPSEFHITGTLKTWSIIDALYKINVPTLLINGWYDEVQDEAVYPFFTHIPNCKWVQFAESSHMPHWEEKERYLTVAEGFLGADK